MPIRWRLTLWFALILAVILVLSGIVLHVLLQSYLNSEVDGNLRVYAARVHGTLSPQQVPDPLNYDVIHSKLPPINEFSSPGIYIELVDSTGKVVVKSDSLGDLEMPVDPALLQKGLAGQVDIHTVSAGANANVRIMASPLYLKDQTLVLEVGQSLTHLETTLHQADLALIVSILVALVLAAVTGGFIVGGAFRPVRRITQTARSIESSADLRRRVGYRGPPDEIGQLATTFDRMIEDLDKAFESQKHFVADASHELRSPLTVIKGNIDLLKRKLTEADRQESLRAIESETTRMVKIVSDLLQLAEVEAGQLHLQDSVSLKEVLHGEWARVQTLAKNRRVLIGREEDLRIKCDPDKLREMLGNLVDNAIRYTAEGGTITLSLFRDGGWAVLQVADTGIGIAPEHLPHLFDRFYRADKARSRASGGTGLGLAIVKSIAGQHGGEVAVASQPGQGSTFTVRLKL